MYKPFEGNCACPRDGSSTFWKDWKYYCVEVSSLSFEPKYACIGLGFWGLAYVRMTTWEEGAWDMTLICTLGWGTLGGTYDGMKYWGLGLTMWLRTIDSCKWGWLIIATWGGFKTLKTCGLTLTSCSWLVSTNCKDHLAFWILYHSSNMWALSSSSWWGALDGIKMGGSTCGQEDWTKGSIWEIKGAWGKANKICLAGVWGQGGVRTIISFRVLCN